MVEWKKMWELTAWDKKFQGVDKSMQSKIIPYKYLLAKDLFALAAPNGKIKLLSTGVQEGWTTEELACDFLSEGEVVTIPWGKSPGAQNPVKYYQGKFVTGDNRIATSIDTNVLNNKFLYYWMYTKSDIIESFYRGAGIQHPNMFKVLTMPVPLLSIFEQERIVGILDTFTASIENLKEQIAQRRKQYEYYRDQLLDLEGKEGVEMKYLLDVLAQPVTDGPHETPSFYEDGIPFISADAIVDNKINFSRKRGYISEEYDLLCQKKYKPQLNDIYLVKSGSTTGKVAIVRTDERFNIWSPLAAIRVNQRNHPYFVYYMLQTKKVQDQVKLKSSQGSQPNLSMRVLEKFIIPVPPLSEQQRIVSILDTFEASIQNLEAQLSQREKQYEYYRNKLLTFE